MAISDTDICNMAISYLGGNPIIDMTDQTPEALLCDTNYAPVRDAVLEDCNWTFATRRYKLSSPEVENPVYEYAYQFRVPVEVLRVLDVDEGMYDWALEEGKILTDSSSINIKCLVRITNPAKFSPSFAQAFSARLAAEISLPLTNSPAQQARMVEMYAAKIRWARGNDGRQGLNKRRISRSTFTRGGAAALGMIR